MSQIRSKVFRALDKHRKKMLRMSELGEIDQDLVSYLPHHEKDFDLKTCSKMGGTPLMFATYCGETNAMQALIAAGTDVNQSNNCGETPLYAAIASARLKEARLLLEAKANANASNHRGELAIECAFHLPPGKKEPLIDLLLEHGSTDICRLIVPTPDATGAVVMDIKISRSTHSAGKATITQPTTPIDPIQKTLTSLKATQQHGSTLIPRRQFRDTLSIPSSFRLPPSFFIPDDEFAHLVKECVDEKQLLKTIWLKSKEHTTYETWLAAKHSQKQAVASDDVQQNTPETKESKEDEFNRISTNTNEKLQELRRSLRETNLHKDTLVLWQTNNVKGKEVSDLKKQYDEIKYEFVSIQHKHSTKTIDDLLTDLKKINHTVVKMKGNFDADLRKKSAPAQKTNHHTSIEKTHKKHSPGSTHHYLNTKMQSSLTHQAPEDHVGSAAATAAVVATKTKLSAKASAFVPYAKQNAAATTFSAADKKNELAKQMATLAWDKALEIYRSSTDYEDDPEFQQCLEIYYGWKNSQKETAVDIQINTGPRGPSFSR